jgi:hypothetical protein
LRRHPPDPKCQGSLSNSNIKYFSLLAGQKFGVFKSAQWFFKQHGARYKRTSHATSANFVDTYYHSFQRIIGWQQMGSYFAYIIAERATLRYSNTH